MYINSKGESVTVAEMATNHIQRAISKIERIRKDKAAEYPGYGELRRELARRQAETGFVATSLIPARSSGDPRLHMVDDPIGAGIDAGEVLELQGSAGAAMQEAEEAIRKDREREMSARTGFHTVGQASDVTIVVEEEHRDLGLEILRRVATYGKLEILEPDIDLSNDLLPAADEEGEARG